MFVARDMWICPAHAERAEVYALSAGTMRLACLFNCLTFESSKGTLLYETSALYTSQSGF
jgi:hypothetical protein